MTSAVVTFTDTYSSVHVYSHMDGYPEWTVPLLKTFFYEVKRQTSDTRFGSAAHLAARFVVFLAGLRATDYFGETIKPGRPLDFLSVGIVESPSLGEYQYVVTCDGETPSVTCNGEDVELSDYVYDEQIKAVWEVLTPGRDRG